MAKLKVKLTFNDVGNTNFEYDRVNGLSSLNIENESKTDVGIDYSIKSNSGTFSAKDIVPYGLVNLENNFINFNNSTDGFCDVCYNEDDEYFYFANNRNNDHYIINRTKDFINYDHTQPISSKINIQNQRIVKFGENLAIASIEDKDFYVLTYNPSNNKWQVNGMVSGGQTNVKFFGFFVVNNMLISSIKTDSGIFNYRSTYNSDNFSLSNSMSALSNLKNNIIYDGCYIEDTYYLLTNNGIYVSSDFVNFTLANSNINIDIYTTKNATIKYFNNMFVVSNGSDCIYFGNDITSLQVKQINELSGNTISKLLQFKDTLIIVPNFISNIIYTKDFNNFNIMYIKNIDNFSNYTFFGSAYNNQSIVFVTGDFSYNDNIKNTIISYIYNFDTNITPYLSIYDYLISKPKYSNIEIEVSLDNNVLNKFTNNGKISYDNDSKEFSLNIQNNLVLLQNKKYKVQIDKTKIGVTNAWQLFEPLITFASGIIGQEFYVDDATKTYMESVNIEFPYLEETSVWEQLDKFCKLCQLCIYPRNNQIIVKRWV